MKNQLLRFTRRLPAAGLGLVLSAPLLAQDDPSVDDALAFELSPFEVRTEGEDIGYRATDTLAGIRMRSDLRDVASAISVVSEQFLRDTGATDNQTLLQYTTGTEVSGTLGNYSDLGSVSPDDTGIRTRPQSATRVRGLVEADLTRDFFLTLIPWDSYNTPRVDIQRGPNSILFGVGSPGGIINADIEGATIGADNGEIELRVGSHGSTRASFNINQTVIEDQLAVRVAALHDRTEYRQRPAYDRDRRLYGAVRIEPDLLKFENARTIINANFETGRIQANRPRVGTPMDHITPWFLTDAHEMHSSRPYNEAGETYLGTVRPMLSHSGYNPFINRNIGSSTETLGFIDMYPNLNIGAAALHNYVEEENREPGDYYQTWFPTSERWLAPGSTGGGFGGSWAGHNALGFAGIFPDPSSSQLSSFTPMLSVSPSTLGNYAIGARRGEIVEDGNIAGLRWPSLGVVSLAGFQQYASGFGPEDTADPFRFASEGVYRDRSIQNTGIFDFYDELLDGENKEEWNDFDAFNIGIEQLFFGDRLGFQLAYDNQEYTEGRIDLLGGAPGLYIDVLSHLPMAQVNDGGEYVAVANPNFGRPLVMGTGGGNFESTTEFETYRFSPYVRIDFERDVFRGDSLLSRMANFILGEHTLSGLLERHEQSNVNYSWTQWAVTPETYMDWTNGYRQDLPPVLGERQPPIISYLGPQLSSASNYPNLGIRGLRARQSLYSAPAYYFNSRYDYANAPDPGDPWADGTLLGIGPNQVGLSGAPAQAENPLNYIGWTQPTTAEVLTWDNPAHRDNLYTGWDETRQVLESWAIVDQWRLMDNHVVFTGGLRKDKLRSYAHSFKTDADGVPQITGRPTTNDPALTDHYTDVERDGTIAWDYPWDEVQQSQYTSELLKTYGIVVKSPEFVNRHLPLDMDFTVFYNYSENFQPEGSRVDIFGENISPPTGETEEYGFSVSALDERVSVRVNWFETKVQNQTMPRTYSGQANTDFVAWTGDELKRGLQFSHPVLWVDRAVNNPDPVIAAEARERLIATNISDFMFAVLPDGTVLDSGADIKAEAATLVDNPDVFISAYGLDGVASEDWTEAQLRTAHEQAVYYAESYVRDLYTTENAERVLTLTGYGEGFQALPSSDADRQMLQNWLANAPDSFGNYPDFMYSLYGKHNPLAGKEGGIPEQDYRPNVAITGDTVSKGVEFEVFLRPTPNWDIMMNATKVDAVRQNLAGSMSDWIEARWESYAGPGGDMLWWQGNAFSETGRFRFGTHAYYDYVLARAEEGNTVPELRPWRFNIITNYRFTEGALDGFSVGGGYRWQDSNIIGYGVIEDPVTGAGSYDVSRPFHGPSEDAVDLWIGYTGPLTDAIDWRIQLNVRDAFSDGDLIPVTTNPDGSVALWRISEGRRWELTTGLMF